MPAIGLFETIYSARAIRRLKRDPVPEELITKVLDAAIRGTYGRCAGAADPVRPPPSAAAA
jgi:hypothetical protein